MFVATLQVTKIQKQQELVNPLGLKSLFPGTVKRKGIYSMLQRPWPDFTPGLTQTHTYSENPKCCYLLQMFGSDAEGRVWTVQPPVSPLGLAERQVWGEVEVKMSDVFKSPH